ncbi:MAG: AMP-dependent synthetase [Acidobacteria bacterium]|nr:MAG: AMP-dependent synthetase [Acidobacteriota bacterium]
MRQVGASTWDELYEFSIRDVEKFTEEVLKFLDIKFDPPYEKLLDTSSGIEFPKWLSGAGLNITEMCLDRWVINKWNDQPAILWEGEDGSTQVLSYSFLADNVAIVTATLRELGIGKGDAVGIHLPMIPETVLSLLAINRVGAIAVPVFSGYGIEAIASRMQAVRAKALITCEGFYRRGKFIDTLSITAEAVTRTESITRVLVTRTAISDQEHLEQVNDAQGPFRFVQFQDHLEKTFPGKTVRQFGVTHNMIDLLGADELGPEPTSAEDPLIILYTSGTTGKPKGIAHTHASFPIKAAQDMAFGTDVGRGTRICWYTDIGWMMGPWLIYGALINGATICIYDGAPDYPTPDRMWEFCAKHKVEILGISPTLIRALSNCGDHLPKKHDLSSLRMFASTGEPWNPAPWWWLFEKVGNSKLPIINYSGGTEIAGGILMGNPLLPIKPCSFPAPCPGMDVDILDEEGKPVGPGKVGELVIRQPWIGMARGFWQEKERYLETYWRRFKDIWVHGDFAMRDKDGHWFILGRSDDTLKVAGKRVGPAEVESLLVAHPLVTEAAVIGVPDEKKGTAMVAFCVLTNSSSQSRKDAEAPKAETRAVASVSRADEGVRVPSVDELKALVAKDMGKPLAPSKIHFVSALPKTRNAKVMRRVIRSAYLGEDPGDLSSLENPLVIEEIRKLGRF